MKALKAQAGAKAAGTASKPAAEAETARASLAEAFADRLVRALMGGPRPAVADGATAAHRRRGACDVELAQRRPRAPPRGSGGQTVSYPAISAGGRELRPGRRR